MEWTQLYFDVPYAKAMLKARLAKESGKYSAVKIQLTSCLQNRKLYSVFVAH